MTDVVTNLAQVKQAISAAAEEALRPAPVINLVAVSKFKSVAQIEPALIAGHRVFGENRVQEASEKWPELRARYHGVELHLIGSLQTNKVAQAVALFDVIEVVDREKLAIALADEMAKQGKRPDLLIQINTGAEDQKGGILPADADAFIKKCRDDLGLPVKGLMCIPPVDEEPALHFALLNQIALNNDLPVLSMGMSDDFATAIKFGATHVRVGTAIFGARAN